MKKIPPIIDFTDFADFDILNETNTTQIIKCHNKNSPYRVHIFKTFKFPNQSSKDQKKILDTFQQISSQKSQYLICYTRFSFFSYESKFHPTFSMKYIPSQTLQSLLQDNHLNEKWTYTDLMNCLFAVSNGMSFLHNHLIYHGNLCPSNIIVDSENQCYLCDFGLYPLKKIYYHSDEIFNNDYKDPYMNDQEPCFKNDVYSFGILLCQFCLIFFRSENYLTLNDYVTNFDEKKLSFLPSLFLELIPKCLFLPVNERPSFQKILEIFQNSSLSIGRITISSLYNDFIKTLYVEKRAMNNDAQALYKLGVMYENGKGVEEDRKKAMFYYKKSATLGNSEAQNNYGCLLQEESSAESIKKGAKYLKMSAEQGNIHGMANYGVALNDGIGTVRNEKLARIYLKKSADLGFPYAQVNYGFGVLNDNDPSHEQIKEGLHYIKLSMSQNFNDAFYTYGIVLYYGKVVEQNKPMAMYYFKIAADMGHVQAMNDYAEGYYKGDGVEINKDIALHYYQMAADKGYENAIEMVQVLKNELQNNSKNPKSKNDSVPSSSSKRSASSKSKDDPLPSSPSKKSANSKSKNDIVSNSPSKKTASSKSKNETVSNSPSKKTVSSKSKNDTVSNSPTKKTTKSKSTENHEQKKEESNNLSQFFSSTVSNNQQSSSHIQSKSPEKPKQSQSDNKVISQLLNLSSDSESPDSDTVKSLKNDNSVSNITKNDEDQVKQETNKNTQNKVYSLLALQEEEEEQSSDDDETSSQSDNINPLVINQMSAKQLIKLGDKMSKENNIQKAIEFYEIAAKKGCPSAYLKCTEICEQFDNKLDYFERAIHSNVPEAFSQWRKCILKYIAFQKDPNVLIQLAKRFEKFNDFSDAASVYRKAKDKHNFAICYEKAKENIDNISDGMHQFHFAKLLEGQNDKNLALSMYKKAFKNGISLAEQKINDLENNS